MIPASLLCSLRARASTLVLSGLATLGGCSPDTPLTTDPNPIGTSDKDSGSDSDDESMTEDDDPGRHEADAGKVAKGPTPVNIAQCTTKTSGLTAERLKQLQAGGAPGDMRFLYPYDATVFPRGLKSPVLMWQGTDAQAADAVYVHMKSSWFEFAGCVKPDAAGRIALPQDAWDQAGAQTPGKSDPFTVELSVIRGSVVKGPISQQLIIAPATLKGSVFYNSYSSPMALAKGAPGGAILRIPAGGEAEVFLGQSGCIGCHSVSAHGNRMVASASETQGVYKLEPNAAVNPPPVRGNVIENVGLTPDGTYYATTGGQLFETDKGFLTADAGLPTGTYQPTFSPDGQWITFGDADPNTGYSALATMSWNPALRTFGAYRKLVAATPTEPGLIGMSIQWPTFLPDSKAVVFADVSKNDLFLVDVSTGTVTMLARAMGFHSVADAATDEKTYLPFGAQELHQSFYPTIAPVAAGGYFWVFFDTSRKYGNVDTTKIEPMVEQPPPIVQPDNPFCALFPGTPLCPDPNVGPAPLPVEPPVPTGVPSRQLWVTALEISADGSYKHDPSAPAFYLPGQEIGSNNHRAFAALDPCLAAGKGCTSGTECCDGFCTEGMCGVPTERCSETEEACESAADCCDKQERCINGFCSVVIF